ncbi:hypothetical protein CMI37_30810 [Candidatus Pacearchaeota archaeon]|nr:hypothetical protein [Candidatus Pacearchaeota archaeon]
MTIEAMGTGLKTRLATIAQLGSNIWAPNEIEAKAPSVFPFAIILQGAVTYHNTFANAIIVQFRAIILFGLAHQPSSLNRLIDYTERSGGQSVYAAIDADKTLGGAADFAVVNSNTGTGSTFYAGQNYLSTEFAIECQEA